ncbi:MAG TPA: HDIG domain-containing protein [Syntrophorhabdales bacterium]|nr:HDIG domain-containing protein [Syntrophorhabdales bacterium]
MKAEKDKPPSRPPFRKYFILLLFSLILAGLINVKLPQRINQYQLGDIANETIRAPSSYAPSNSDITLKKGEVIVREGQKIGSEDLKKLTLLQSMEKTRKAITGRMPLLFLLFFAFVAIIFEFADKNIKKFRLSEKDLIFSASLTVFTVFLIQVALLLFNRFAPDYASVLFFVFPLFLFGMVMRIVLFSEAVLVFSMILALSVAFTVENGFPIFIYAFLGNLLASYFSGRVEKRLTLLGAGLFSGLVMAFVMFLFHILLGYPLSEVPLQSGLILIGAVGSSILTAALLPAIEHIFDYTTNFKLLELANLEHPLLEQLMVQAPGTYHHSIVVGNLCRAAAEGIGAHPILTRVAAYYHDVGKLKMPHYFIENRRGFEDAHKNLTPSMSSLIILSHVKEGVELAERYRLGKKICEIIREHHGTSLVSYFYKRAKDMEDPGLAPAHERDFRYAGPKPQTREAGIVMLADAVEAASRTLEDPTPKRIETHVQTIVEQIFVDGQLDDCELTLKDLHSIQKSFIAILIGIFHQRIEYPERTEDDGAHQEYPRLVEAGPKAPKKHSRRIAGLFRAAG